MLILLLCKIIFVQCKYLNYKYVVFFKIFFYEFVYEVFLLGSFVGVIEYGFCQIQVFFDIFVLFLRQIKYDGVLDEMEFIEESYFKEKELDYYEKFFVE